MIVYKISTTNENQKSTGCTLHVAQDLLELQNPVSLIVGTQFNLVPRSGVHWETGPRCRPVQGHIGIQVLLQVCVLLLQLTYFSSEVLVVLVQLVGIVLVISWAGRIGFLYSVVV